MFFKGKFYPSIMHFFFSIKGNKEVFWICTRSPYTNRKLELANKCIICDQRLLNIIPVCASRYVCCNNRYIHEEKKNKLENPKKKKKTSSCINRKNKENKNVKIFGINSPQHLFQWLIGYDRFRKKVLF